MRWTNLVTDSGANGSATLDTSAAREAQVVIWASTGTPDGTVSIYYTKAGSPVRMLLKAYATPTAAKTFTGPTGDSLEVALAGNSTGKVTVLVGLR